MLISKEAERLLKIIARKGTVSSDFTDKFSESAICALVDASFVSETVTEIDFNIMQPSSYTYQITDKGLAYLYTLSSDRFRFTIPLVLSCIALLLSALSIILSPFFSAFFSNLYSL